MDTIEEIKKLKALLENGAISNEEYYSLKSKLINDGGSQPLDENTNERLSLQTDDFLSDQSKHDSFMEGTKLKSQKKFGKKSIIAVLILLLIIVSFVSGRVFTPSSLAKERNDWSTQKLKGKVKSIEEKLFYLEGDGEKKIHIDNYRYNETGKMIEHNAINFQGNSNGELITKDTFEYDSNGNLIGKNQYNPPTGSKFSSTYLNDDKGNNVEEHNENSNENVVVIKYSNKYDSKGNLIEVTGLKNGDINSRTITYKYNSVGKVVEIINNSQAEITSFNYDSKGNITEEYCIIGGSIVKYKYTYKYDNEGHEVEKLVYDHEGKPSFKNNYKYIFDKVGNWVKKSTFLDEEKGESEILKRIIIYY
jgi:hypothetical protein